MLHSSASYKDRLKKAVRINLTLIPLSVWRDKFAHLPRSTLLQSYDYARFIASRSVLRPRWGVIYADDVEVGLVQIMTAQVARGLISTVTLDRGPLWFSSQPDRTYTAGFFEAFAQLYPRRFGRARRVIPELSSDIETSRFFGDAGYHSVRTSLPYQTAWLDLTVSTNCLRSNLARSWRNHLVQGERQPVDIVFSHYARDATELIKLATIDQKVRGYRGLHGSELARLAAICAMGDGIILTRAVQDGKMVAGALFLRHGQCATWQTGWVGHQGRVLNANHRLLWESLLYLRQNGIVALDLGGYNDHDARMVGVFKSGLGGQHVTLMGQYS